MRRRKPDLNDNHERKTKRGGERLLRNQVAIDARMLSDCGIGSYLRNLLENLAAVGNGLEFLVLLAGDNCALPMPSGRFRLIPARSPIYSLREQWEIARLARSVPIFHAPHYNVPLLYRGKLLVTIHDLIHITDPNFRRSPASFAYARPMLKLAVRAAEHIVAVSEFTRGQIVDAFQISSAKITVIHHGISPHFRLQDHREAIARVSAAMGMKRPYILLVGNFKPHKNVKTLIRAFALLHARQKIDHELLILGRDGKGKIEIIRECQIRGMAELVHFVPHVNYETLPLVYGAAELLVIASYLEGFGLPALEAMACGTPVVCSRAASLPEVAGPAEEYFDPASDEDLAAAIERVLASPERQAELRRKGLERVKLFSWDECARRHLALYRGLAGA